MTTLTVTIGFPNIRMIGQDKQYYINQCQEYAELIAGKTSDIKRVEFGKQDIRGGICITLYNSKHCVPQQRHFDSKEHMLGFIVGYNHAISNREYI